MENDSENTVIIAPFSADTDFSQYDPAFYSYREDTTPAILARATDVVMAINQYAQELPDFQVIWTLIVTWHDAVLYDSDSTEVSLKITLEIGQHFLFFKNCFPSQEVVSS